MLSIIIPIYNSSRYLQPCLQSIANQSYQDIEVLLINDGSTDDSLDICNQFVQRDPRFKIFTKSNGGVSSARNFGITKITGEWVLFVDSDDLLFTDSIETLYNGALQNNIDMVMCGYEEYDQNDKLCYFIKERTTEILTKEQGIMQLFKPKYYRYQGFLWNKLLKCSIIKENGLRFNENIYFNEDRLFLFEYLLKTKGSVFYNTQPVYKYFLRNGSAMFRLDNGKYDPKFRTDMKAMSIIMQKAKEHSIDRDIILQIKQWTVWSYDRIVSTIKKTKGNNNRQLHDIEYDFIKTVGLLYWAKLKFSRLLFNNSKKRSL